MVSLFVFYISDPSPIIALPVTVLVKFVPVLKFYSRNLYLYYPSSLRSKAVSFKRVGLVSGMLV